METKIKKTLAGIVAIGIPVVSIAASLNLGKQEYELASNIAGGLGYITVVANLALAKPIGDYILGKEGNRKTTFIPDLNLL